MNRSILAGAICGLQAWLIYGIVEFVLACGIPMLSQPGTEVLGWQWRLVAMLFGVYALSGLLLGGLGGALLALVRQPGDRRANMEHKLFTGLTLSVAFAANLFTVKLMARKEYVGLAVALLLAVLGARALVSNLPHRRLAFLANPWAMSLLLLTFPWVSSEALSGHSPLAKTVGSTLVFGVIIVMANWWRGRRSGAVHPMRRRAMAATSAVILLLMSGVLILEGRTAVGANKSFEGSVAGRCNVLLITMDTVRADHLSVYGYERDTTPHLRDWAREATVYNRAIAAADMTLSSHASIFTGVYPSWHGAYIAPPAYPLGRPLGSNRITLAEILASKGYSTAAVVTNFAYLQPSLQLNKGFKSYELPLPAQMSSHPFYMRESARRVLSLAVDTARFDAQTFPASGVNRHASAFLEHVKNKGSFFLFLNYMDAHSPYTPPPPFNSRFPGRDTHFRPGPDHKALTKELDDGDRHVSPSERQHLISQYDGAIAYMDSEIDDLLVQLRKLGLYENTLIIIASDHGEAFGERDLMTHGRGSAYQDEIHIPLLIKYPGQHEARVSDAWVSHVDLMPTVLTAAGYPVPSGAQGHSLLPLEAEGDGTVYSEERAFASLPKRFRGVRRAIFCESLKLISWTDGPLELYDLAADPDETHNLYRADDPRATALAGRLQKWAAAAPRQFEATGKLDKNSFEKLKSLGYAQ